MFVSTGLVLLHNIPGQPVPLPAATAFCVVHATGKQLLDELALIVARLFEVPVCLVLLDPAYDWRAAAAATGPVPLPPPGSLCAAAIARSELARLHATQQHPSALVSAAVAHRLHLGPVWVEPLVTRLHQAIGALCLVGPPDCRAGTLQPLVLPHLATAAALLVDLRASAAEAQDVARFWQQVAQALTPVLRHLLIAVNRLRSAPSATDRAAAWLRVRPLLELLQQQLS